MDPVIIAALITAAGAIIAALIGVIYHQHYSHKKDVIPPQQQSSQIDKSKEISSNTKEDTVFETVGKWFGIILLSISISPFFVALLIGFLKLFGF